MTEEAGGDHVDDGRQMHYIDEELERNHAEYIFEKQELGTLHNPYDQEVREFTSIENGDIETLRKSLEENYAGEIGTLAADPLRNAKNRGIVVIALASRAAIRGGVLPETAFSLSDTFIQRIELCRDVESVMRLFHAAEFQYAQMVREIRGGNAGKGAPPSANDGEKLSDHYLDRCKTYIFAHLHEKISVSEMARAIGLNANYLSDLFRRCAGITLTGYIQNEKIRLAKNLLIYSEESIPKIAEYVNFPSQSYFGKLFKEKMHMTPRQYRESYKPREFLQNITTS